MPKLRTADELTALRDRKRRELASTRATSTQIYIGMGTCGIAAGARETMAAIRAELERRRIGAAVSIVGCIGMCAREPLVDVQQAGKPRVTYGNITADRVARLIEEHLIKGLPVKEWAIGRLDVE